MMQRTRQLSRRGALALLAVLAAGATLPAVAAPQGGHGRVFALTNAADGNAVATYVRTPTGLLLPAGHFATGGEGTGEGLGSQGALTLSRDRRWLLAVNAGSDELSLLRVTPFGPLLTDVVGSGGSMPTSVAVRGDLVYVLHAGVPNDVRALRILPFGRLEPVAGSERALSGPDTAPAQVELTPLGDQLVVTERGTNSITLFDVAADGTLGQARPMRSAGETPFGFAFARVDRLLVSEAFGGAPGLSAMSSYDLGGGMLQTLSASVPTMQTAACWVGVTRDRRFAYTTNTGSASVTGYAIDPASGALARLDPDGVSAATGPGPIDLAFDAATRFLYVLNGGDGTLSAYAVLQDGSLLPLPGAGGLPANGAAGLAAF